MENECGVTDDTETMQTMSEPPTAGISVVFMHFSIYF